MPPAEAAAAVPRSTSIGSVRGRLSAWSRLVRPTDGVGMTLLIAIVLVGPSLLSGNNLSVATTGFVIAIALLGLGVVTGRAGMISLVQVGFMAIGAWMFTWLQLHVPGLSFPLAALIAGLAALPFGLIVGGPALRLRGVLLGVVTLALATALSVYLTVKEFPGLSSGFTVTAPSWLTSQQSYYTFCGVVFILAVILTSITARTRIGFMWSSIRHSERATAALGRGVLTSKLSAFAMSAFLGGLAGALLVGQFGIVSSDSFQPVASMTLFALAIMVGARYPEGALLGGMLYAFMPIWLGDLHISQDFGNLLFAVGAVVGLRGGFGAAEELRERIGRRRQRRSRDAVGKLEPVVPPLGIDPSPTNGAVPNGPADSDATPALEIKSLTHKYGEVTALSEVNLVVPRGAVVALIGPNGAGKSTLIDCASGFTHQTSGQILVAGQDMAGVSASKRARAGVRRTFQQGRTIPDLTVEQYVRLGLSSHQNRALDRTHLVELLAFLDCPPPSTVIKSIDVGTRRLIEVCAALAARPAIVMLDEPSAGLGTTESLALAARIASIPSLYGPSVLLVEHDMELVNAAASQVVVMDFGNVIASGPPADVMRNTNVVHAYLGEEVTV
jgi:branched-chain amino acid transport system permease protein